MAEMIVREGRISHSFPVQALSRPASPWLAYDDPLRREGETIANGPGHHVDATFWQVGKFCVATERFINDNTPFAKPFWYRGG